jgi:enoyl-[acyl-carrier protein] reductase I
MYGSFADVTPLRRNITIEDVGKTALWLASDLSSAVTGEVLFVDGGFNIVGVPIGD